MIAMYEELGQVAVYRTLSGDALIEAVIQKIIEEVKEVPINGDRNVIIKEIADVQQGLVDLMSHLCISDTEVEGARLAKLAKKGGFARGVFVETLTLSDDDSWTDYYRAEPDKYPEI